jgi:hypothetical protein
MSKFKAIEDDAIREKCLFEMSENMNNLLFKKDLQNKNPAQKFKEELKIWKCEFCRMEFIIILDMKNSERLLSLPLKTDSPKYCPFCGKEWLVII